MESGDCERRRGIEKGVQSGPWERRTAKSERTALVVSVADRKL